MIKSFANAGTEALFDDEKLPKKFKLPKELHSKALTKLRLLDKAVVITDLYIPPSNRFEALSGNRAGQYSISINMRWRICFRFEDGNALDVEITDHYK